MMNHVCQQSLAKIRFMIAAKIAFLGNQKTIDIDAKLYRTN